MNRIECNVSNCAHNKNSACYSSRVNIGGFNATNYTTTCCTNFLNNKVYSTLTSNINGDYDYTCDCIICNVSTCKYNLDKNCIANHIQINSSYANLYDETNCLTFEHLD